MDFGLGAAELLIILNPKSLTNRNLKSSGGFVVGVGWFWFWFWY